MTTPENVSEPEDDYLIVPVSQARATANRLRELQELRALKQDRALRSVRSVSVQTAPVKVTDAFIQCDILSLGRVLLLPPP